MQSLLSLGRVDWKVSTKLRQSGCVSKNVALPESKALARVKNTALVIISKMGCKEKNKLSRLSGILLHLKLHPCGNLLFKYWGKQSQDDKKVCGSRLERKCTCVALCELRAKETHDASQQQQLVRLPLTTCVSMSTCNYNFINSIILSLSRFAAMCLFCQMKIRTLLLLA